MIDRADVIVIGAGAAGCVAAARLSEDASRRVVLIEAGRDLLPGTEPVSIRDVYSFSAAFNPANHWPGLTAWTGRPDGKGCPRPYEQARIMGGGTSINGQQASIGLPADYDNWVEHGAAGWGWADVAPWFERLVGADGIFPVSTVPRREWPPFSNAFVTAAELAGYERLANPNREFTDGWFELPTMSNGKSRTSAASTYLTEKVRGRSNLVILTDCRADSVVLEDGAAAGIDLATPEGLRRIATPKIIVAAGAIGSPLLLQRSGIGPAEWVSAAGLPVLHSIDGIGRNLQEHPSFALSGLLAPGQERGMIPRRHILAAMRLSSESRPLGPSDLYVVGVNRAAWHAIGWRISSLFGWVNKPLSRGWVKIGGKRAGASGVDREVALNLLDHPDDMSRLTELSRRMFAMLTIIRDQGIITDIGLPVAGTAFRAFLVEDTLRATFMHAAGLAVDRSRLARRALLRSFEPAEPVFAADDEALATLIRSRVTPGWHPTGTCRMGPANDPASVVHTRDGAVHGLDGLHVIDASVMLAIPRANTALPTLMIAERLVDAIRRDS